MNGRPIVGAGLKMFLGYAETVGYLRELAASAGEFDGVSVFVLPSFPVLAAAQELLAGSPVRYGAQDAHWEEAGPYTGCVSPAVLRELGCTFVEVGHAERRRLFRESDDMVARKALAAVRCGLEPIVCVGEERQAGNGAAAAVVADQAAALLESLPDDADLVIAYEPVWAIDAEAAAEPQHVAAVVAEIGRRAAGRAGNVRILYGGSVGPSDVAGLLAAGVDGLFVGRAAIPVSGLREVVESVQGGGVTVAVAIGADDAGLDLKDRLAAMLRDAGVEVTDYGAHPGDGSDYPDVALTVAKAVARGEHARAILICGTGIGMAIAANKVPGVYAAQVHDPYSAERARKSNNAQVMTLGARVVGPELAESLVRIWLDSEFQGGASARKVAKIAAAEARLRPD